MTPRQSIEALTAPGPKDPESNPEIDGIFADPAYFIDTYCVIDDAQEIGGTGGTTPFKLWPAQRGVVEEVHANDRVIILKARQLGISWIVCAYVLWYCMTHVGKVVLIFSKTKDDSKEMIRRITALYVRLPEWLRAECPVTGRPHTGSISFTNGSRIKSFPSNPTAGAGETASIVVMDEAAKMKFGKALYDNIKPAIDNGRTKLIMLSTAYGVSNIFYTIWKKSVDKLNNYHTIFLPYWARPGRDQAWYDNILRDSSDPDEVRENYPRNALEAFLSSGRVRFQSIWILRQEEKRQEEIRAGISGPIILEDYVLQYQTTQWFGILRSIDRLDVFRPPTRTRRVAIGCDVAEGLEKGDFSCATVIDVDTLEELACAHGHWEPDEFAEICFKLGMAYRGWIVVERNNHGHTILSKLRTLCAEYDVDPELLIAVGPDGAQGWLTKNQVVKASCIDEIAIGLRDGLLTVRSVATLMELQEYRKLRDGKTGAPEDSFDDRVMSWAVVLGWLAYAMPDAVAKLTHNPMHEVRWGSPDAAASMNGNGSAESMVLH